jgi:hypothetical protein
MRGKGMTLEAINLNNTVDMELGDHFNFNWHQYIYDDNVAPPRPRAPVPHDRGATIPRIGASRSAMGGFGERSVTTWWVY